MENSSLNRSEIVTIKVGEKSGDKTINLPKGILLGIAKFDSDNAPGFLRIGISQNGVDVQKAVHHKAFEQSAGGARYIDKYRGYVVDVAGAYDITATTDTAVVDNDYKFEMEFIIVSPDQLPYFKPEN